MEVVTSLFWETRPNLLQLQKRTRIPLLLLPFYDPMDFVWDYLGKPVPER